MSLSRAALRSLCAAATLAALLGPAAGAVAQEPPTTPANGAAPAADAAAKEAPAPPRGPADPYDRGTPQGAIVGYLSAARDSDWARAARYLDLRRLPPSARDARGPILARELKIVLDRTLWVDVDAVSTDPEGDRDDGLPANREEVGQIESAEPPVPVYLDRVPRADDGVPVWKVSTATVNRIPELWHQLGDGPLVAWLPTPFFTISFLEIRLWQWIALLGLGAAAAFAAVLGVRVIHRVFRPLMRRFVALRLVSAPVTLLLGLGLFSAGRLGLGLSVPAQHAIGVLLRIGTVVALTWVCFRLVDAVAHSFDERLRGSRQPAAGSMLALGRRAAKALLGAVALLASLQSLGVNVTALMAGLGFGGLAFALAAQKSLENLFGGMTIVADQPVRVGDFCRFGDRVGTVEDVGLRSTRVRTLDRTVVTIPNAQFATMEIENFSRRDRFWYHPTIGLRYETRPDQLRWALVELRKLLYAHPLVDPNPARIRFAGFGASSLDLDIFAYVNARDYDEFLEVCEDLNLHIMDVVERAGTGFAFPSQTVYVRPDDGLDGDAGRRAEQQVTEWRGRNELPLPGFPPETIRSLDGTLTWPPEGSALRRRNG
jgi:MscS family membrane protein